VLTDSASVIVPVYNESDCIIPNTTRLVSYLRDDPASYELILVENGSIDDTLSKAMYLSKQYPEVKVISLEEPCLGESLRVGIRNALHDKVVYFPIDLSVNLGFIPECLPLLDKYHIVSGSKRMEDSKDIRPAKRRLASKGYHYMVRKLFNTALSDTTCAKAYRRSAILELLSHIPSRSMVYETELLIEAQKEGLRIHQVPVTVTDPRKGRQPLGYKVMSKLQDLLSLRLDMLAIILGGIMFLLGSLGILTLSVLKLMHGGGFLNPYSFLSSMLLVIFGFQCIIYGAFARLMLQLRSEVTGLTSTTTLLPEDSGNVFKEKEH
jgi:glycosyltransferase involved in cell wall biosynthesis